MSDRKGKVAPEGENGKVSKRSRKGPVPFASSQVAEEEEEADVDVELEQERESIPFLQRLETYNQHPTERKPESTMLYWDRVVKEAIGTSTSTLTDEALYDLIQTIPRFPDNLRKRFSDSIEQVKAFSSTIQPIYQPLGDEVAENEPELLGCENDQTAVLPPTVWQRSDGELAEILRRLQVAEQQAREERRRREEAEQRAREERRRREEAEQRAREERRGRDEAEQRAVRGEVLASLSSIAGQVKVIYYQLMVLSGLNQGDPPPTGSLTGEAQEMSELVTNDGESGLPQFIENFRILEDVCRGSSPLEDFLQSNHDDSNLRTFSQNLKKYLSEAEILNKSDIPKDTNSEKYKELMNGSLPLFRSQLLGDMQLEEEVDSLSELSSKSKKYVPGPRSTEIAGAQPYLLALLQSLGICRELSDSTHEAEESECSDSPAKSHIGSSRMLIKTLLRKKRIMDKSLFAPGRYVYFFRDDAIEIPVEEKSGERCDQNPDALLEESVAQIVSHLAKHVGVAFNFAGFGIDSFATGLVLTPAYVKIVRLRLENMGTTDATLSLEQSRCLPLMSEKHFDRWCGGDPKEKERWVNLREELFKGSKDQMIPPGLIALWNLMGTTRKKLFGPSNGFAADELGNMIAYGSYATVHEGHVKDERGEQVHHTVIKVSRYGAKGQIDRESQVLKALNGQIVASSVHKNIPTWISDKAIEICIDGVRKLLPALTTKPRGIEVQIALLSNPDLLDEVGQQMKAALDFVHRSGYLHNDVTPKNIVIVDEKYPMLIDFGIATKKGETVKGFRGTACFVHRSVFEKFSRRAWKPNESHDFTSLGFTMAALAARKPLPWPYFHPGRAKEGDEFLQWATNRLKIARKNLKNHPKDWMGWCNLDEAKL